MARILVTDAGWASAVTIIRSLGRAGHHVVAGDDGRRSPGFYSRHASGRLLYPAPSTDPEAMVDVLLDAAERQRLDLVFPVTDDTILPLERHRERFEAVTRLALPSSQALAAALDKEATRALAESLGIPTPRTAFVTGRAQAHEHAELLGWPVVLKPQRSRSYAGETAGGIEALSVTYANDHAGLAAAMARFEGVCGILLQEYCAGEGYGVELLLDEGKPLAVFQHRRLREVPITGGASSYRESMRLDRVLLDHAVRLLAELRWTGLAMVEFKVGTEGPRLMEVNGRPWGSLALAVKSGVDFPRLAAELFLGDRPRLPAAQAGYRVGVRSRHLELETIWIGSVLRPGRRHPYLPTPPRRAAAIAALRLLWPRDGFDLLTADDVVPGLVDAARVARKLVGKVAHA